jgi:hypothetical protein
MSQLHWLQYWNFVNQSISCYEKESQSPKKGKHPMIILTFGCKEISHNYQVSLDYSKSLKMKVI